VDSRRQLVDDSTDSQDCEYMNDQSQSIEDEDKEGKNEDNEDVDDEDNEDEMEQHAANGNLSSG